MTWLSYQVALEKPSDVQRRVHCLASCMLNVGAFSKMHFLFLCASDENILAAATVLSDMYHMNATYAFHWLFSLFTILLQLLCFTKDYA